MSNQPRVVKVLAALLFSMTFGAVVLMGLGQNPPAAGPWSLSRSLRSDSTQLAVNSLVPQLASRWNQIEVCLSGTRSGNIESLAELTGLTNAKDLNCHFVVCNGRGGEDGQVLATDKWLRQQSISPRQGWQGGNSVIRICVVSDGEVVRTTDAQARRVQALVTELSRRFDVTGRVLYPAAWHL